MTVTVKTEEAKTRGRILAPARIRSKWAHRREARMKEQREYNRRAVQWMSLCVSTSGIRAQTSRISPS